MSDNKPDKFFTLSAVVYSCLEDIQVGSERFNQFLNYAIDGARELALDYKNEICFGEFSMTAWKSLDYPPGMVDWNILGFREGNDIRVFVQDKNIPKFRDLVNCVPQDNPDPPSVVKDVTDTLIPFIGTSDYFSVGGNHFYGKLIRGNYAGYFDVDDKNKRFNFKNVVKTNSKIYMEWMGDGINYNGQTIIHPYAFMALKNWVHWRRVKFDRKYGQGEVAEYKREYTDSIHNLAVRNLNLTIDDVRDALSHGYGQTVNGI